MSTEVALPIEPLVILAKIANKRMVWQGASAFLLIRVLLASRGITRDCYMEVALILPQEDADQYK